ncbi:hypothetical protein [Xanthobacter sp. 126]|uniref:hypothetical protein n=1 Tax=Xanthobacter sp. 126 TaxID=1131814 RepID=UPI00045E5D88|nr:hypothetical protein [Xanthobacter sp. 126]
MIAKLFGRGKMAREEQDRRKAATFKAVIDAARETNPVVHLKVCAEELVHRLFEAMKDEQGVHLDSLLAIIGSLGGFCCVDTALKQAAALKQSSREFGIVDVETHDGGRYYFGDPINYFLGESNMSLWGLVAGMINELGSEEYPDFPEIAGHVARTIGEPEFGFPRLPGHIEPRDLPVNYVRGAWPAVLPLVEHWVPVLEERVVVFGLAAQNVMQIGKDVIPPPVAGKLIMECAVPMAKLDPARLWA